MFHVFLLLRMDLNNIKEVKESIFLVEKRLGRGEEEDDEDEESLDCGLLSKKRESVDVDPKSEAAEVPAVAADSPSPPPLPTTPPSETRLLSFNGVLAAGADVVEAS